LSRIELPTGMEDEMRAAWHRYLDALNPFRPALHAYCHRLTRDVWDAEDLVQDTLLRAFARLGLVHDPVRNPRAYMLRTATNLWIDKLRRREREAAALASREEPAQVETSEPGSVRDAGRILMQRLPPQERAVLVLKDVFDLSLEESAEVLETTIGAVKAALHRGRKKLRERDPSEQPRSDVPSTSFVDQFVELFNAEDKSGLLELLLDSATVQNVGVSYAVGVDQRDTKHSWFDGAFSYHTEWGRLGGWESQRAERAVYRGEPVVLVYHSRGGDEAVEVILRLQEQEGKLSRLSSYGFCPETMRVVGAELGIEIRTGLYRYPTPVPGHSYLEAAADRGAKP